MSNENFLADLKGALDKITKKAKKNIPVYAEQVKDVASKYSSIGKEKINIKIFEGKIDSIYEEIGEYVYTNRKSKEVTPLLKKLKTKLDTIEKHSQKIEQLNKKIEKLKKGETKTGTPTKKSSTTQKKTTTKKPAKKSAAKGSKSKAPKKK